MRQKCFRYTARPNSFRQSYQEYTPKEGYDRCQHFIANKYADKKDNQPKKIINTGLLGEK